MPTIPVDHDPFENPVEGNLLPVDYDPFANPMSEPTQAMTQGQSERMGQAVSSAYHWWADQPSWMQQAAELERQQQTDPAGDLERRIAFASGMIGPTELSIARVPHLGTIDTRLPTAVGSTGEVGGHTIDLEALKSTPELFKKNTALVQDYPGMPEALKSADADVLANHFVHHVKDNLLWLYDQIPPEIAQRSMLWYDGARNIIDRWAPHYGVPDTTVSGVIASMSPQKDWFQNVDLARRVLDIHTGPVALEPMTAEMERKFQELPSLNKPEYQKMLDDLKGNSLRDIDAMDKPDSVKTGLKALWIRLRDEAHNEKSYPLVSPEGNFLDPVKTSKGENAKVAWGSLTEIGKAVQAIESKGDPQALNTILGERHKIRSFYNNMLDPNSARGDVTIDTHAVAAGLLRPLSGNSLEVAHNFANYPGKGLPSAGRAAATGASGTYALFHEAYQQAAAERGILPRQMQSVTWEAVRGLFPDTWKTAKNAKIIDDLWREFGAGKATLEDTRNAILDKAGGVTPPDWHRPSPGSHAPLSYSAQSQELPRVGVYGPSAEGSERGGGSGASVGSPHLGLWQYSLLPVDYDPFGGH